MVVLACKGSNSVLVAVVVRVARCSVVLVVMVGMVVRVAM